MQGIEGGCQNDCDGTSQLSPEPFQIVQLYEDLSEDVGVVSDSLVENIRLHGHKVKIITGLQLIYIYQLLFMSLFIYFNYYYRDSTYLVGNEL